MLPCMPMCEPGKVTGGREEFFRAIRDVSPLASVMAGVGVLLLLRRVS